MSNVKNVILVHGAWADGSSWAKVIPTLLAKGLAVTAVQLPLATLADDVATVRREIALVDGPVLLVGHSYGGVVITESGVDPKVAGLVYVAAFAPDSGESAGALLASVPPSPVVATVKPGADGIVRLSRSAFIEHFASGLPEVEKGVLCAVQGPVSVNALGGAVTVPAWKTKPAFCIVATEDQAIPPALQRTMAKRSGAQTAEARAGHLVMVSHPGEVAALILKATGQN